MDEAPIPEVDPAGADASLRHAPLTVRKASAWVEQQKREAPTIHKVGPFLPVSLFFGSLFLAGAVASGFGEPAGAAVMAGGWAAAAGSLVWLLRSPWHKANTWAHTTLTRWKQLDGLGIGADLTAPAESPKDLEAMVQRIEALAGEGPIAEAAIKALERSRRLQTEKEHLASIATGQPDADAALDAAGERIETELARIRARLAEAYARLVERETGTDADLDDALERLAAELEVDRDLKRRQAAAAARRVTS